MSDEVVTVERVIPASPESIFELLVDPRRHRDVDGSGSVRDPKGESTVDAAMVSAVLNKPLEIDTLAEAVRECAGAVVLPDGSMPCPPADSDIRSRMDRSGSFYTN